MGEEWAQTPAVCCCPWADPWALQGLLCRHPSAQWNFSSLVLCLSLVSCWATCSAHGNTYLFSLCLISPKIGQRQSLKSLAELSTFPGLEVEPVPAALRDAEMKTALGNCPYFSFLLLFFVFFSSYCFKPWNLIFWLQEYLIKVLHEDLLVPETPHGISWQQGTPDLCFASVPVNFLF